ncbi:hypothetical protein CPC08DRAFT_267828 [Agrocybe pediades]|nr:hypothetical protein CPC08DRAFT_267828 [Agrocybe pediades]
MSFLKRIFSKKNEEDYETILSNLANDVQQRQAKLSGIRLRERRATLTVTLYTLAAWVAYVSLWYLNALPDLKSGNYIVNRSVERAIKGLPVAVGPIVILFIRRIVQIWYKRKEDAEEKTLKELMKKRRDKVEEIKKKTNYYSTRDLIQKYDEASPSATPLRQRIPPAQPAPSTPQRQVGPGNPNTNGKAVMQTPAPSASLQAHLSPATPGFPMAAPRKQWYDKLADALLGEDDPNVASPSSRYALICEKCFSHNGLVKESMWEDAQYLCPKCGHFNASARSKKNQRHSISPIASAASSPPHPDVTLPQSALHPPRPTTLVSPTTAAKDLPTVDRAEPAPMDVDTTTS